MRNCHVSQVCHVNTLQTFSIGREVVKLFVGGFSFFKDKTSLSIQKFPYWQLLISGLSYRRHFSAYIIRFEDLLECEFIVTPIGVRLICNSFYR